jgi:hypothetical protein
MIKVISDLTADLMVGGEWGLLVCVQNPDREAVPGATVTMTITDPADVNTTPTVVDLGAGLYRTVVYPATAGRWTAHIASIYGAAYLTAYVLAPAVPPDVDDVDTYLLPHSHSPETLQLALDVEEQQQRDMCRVTPYTANLRGALLRRVACNLARKALPLAVLQGDADSGSSSVLPGNDPEVRRLEGSRRKLVMG